MKRAKLFLSVFLLTIVIFGLSELAYENDVFAITLIPCCSNGIAQYPAPCITQATANLKTDDCGTSYVVSYMECVDLSFSGQVCGDPLSSCSNGGTCYGWCYYNGEWGWFMSK